MAAAVAGATAAAVAAEAVAAAVAAATAAAVAAEAAVAAQAGVPAGAGIINGPSQSGAAGQSRRPIKFLERALIFVLGFLGALIARLLAATLRWENTVFGDPDIPLLSDKPGIILFWHNRQIMMPWCYRKTKGRPNSRRMYVLISEHKDGRIVAQAMKCLGIDSVAGSSSRGGQRAAGELISKLKEGHHITITPDGPRGPVYKLKYGVLRIAAQSQAPIYPTAVAAQRCWRFKSWDRMILPKPFSRAVTLMGKPFYVPQELDQAQLEKYANDLERAMIEITAAADNYWG